jgi:hypothetical protein
VAKRSRKQRTRAPGTTRQQAPAKRRERAAETARQPRAGAPSRIAPREERPPAPWGSFPLVELVVLLAIAFFIAGIVVQGRRGAVMIGAGVALGALAGLEVSIREHFAGYRSHTALLAGALGVGAMVIASLAAGSSLNALGRIAILAGVFGASFWFFRTAFKKRSGGLSFRIGGFR